MSVASDQAFWDRAGLFTDTPNPGGPEFARKLAGLGYSWVIQQAQNGPDNPDPTLPATVKPIDLSIYAGLPDGLAFDPGSWGVSYYTQNFQRDGHALAEQALSNGSRCLMIDLEFAITSAPAPPDDVAAMIRELAAFPGPKGISVLGAASGHNHYPVDVDPWLAAGFHFFPQAYYQLAYEYEPGHCIEHWAELGVPLERIHLTLYNSPSDFQPDTTKAPGRPIGAAEYVALLVACDYATPDISIFMPELEFGYGYDILGRITMQHSPPSPPSNATETRTAMLGLGNAQEQRWPASIDKHNQRIGLADDILRMPDAKFRTQRAAIRTAVGV